MNTVWLREIFSFSIYCFLSVQSIDVTLCSMTRDKADQQRSRVANSVISTNIFSFHQARVESVGCIDPPQTSNIRLKTSHTEAVHIDTQTKHLSIKPASPHIGLALR